MEVINMQLTFLQDVSLPPERIAEVAKFRSIPGRHRRN